MKDNERALKFITARPIHHLPGEGLMNRGLMTFTFCLLFPYFIKFLLNSFSLGAGQ